MLKRYLDNEVNMKSSSIGRSSLSRESMDLIENLSNLESEVKQQDSSKDELYENYENDAPNEYLRSSDNEDYPQPYSKSKEIDMLWQNFKAPQIHSNSPFMFIVLGFLLGVITTVAIVFLFGGFTNRTSVHTPLPVEESIVDDTANINDTDSDINQTAEDEISDENNQTEVNDLSNVKTKKYVIKEGDTVEKIIRNEYGSYSPEKAEAIMKVNNLDNLDHISIDQVLLLPIEK